LQTVPARLPQEEGNPNGAARAGGFSLHAGVAIAASERETLERLCRCVSRPPVAADRLALTASGQVRYTLKTPYRDGTTHIVLEPLELMARLAARVPPPRMDHTRYHGVFAPHSRLRARRGMRPAGVARQGLSAAGSGSLWCPSSNRPGLEGGLIFRSADLSRYTCYSVPASSEHAGLLPRICDVDPSTFSPDLDSLAGLAMVQLERLAAITGQRVAAVVAKRN
jgi:hypothetical protein